MENAVEETLARVGPGTPSGEVFRRYWLPIEVAANLGGRRGEFLGTNNPLRVRVLGENLVLFRRRLGQARPGRRALRPSGHLALLRPRGGELYSLSVSRLGLRSRWKLHRYAGRAATSNFKSTVKQPAYPCWKPAA